MTYTERYHFRALRPRMYRAWWIYRFVLYGALLAAFIYAVVVAVGCSRATPRENARVTSRQQQVAKRYNAGTTKAYRALKLP